MYHDFAVEEGTGPVLLGEVSQCNDDNTDNRFNPPVGRFPKIEEDEAPYPVFLSTRKTAIASSTPLLHICYAVEQQF